MSFPDYELYYLKLSTNYFKNHFHSYDIYRDINRNIYILFSQFSMLRKQNYIFSTSTIHILIVQYLNIIQFFDIGELKD